jgi:NADPH:quinone reductase-like Zn-dependent oxidoreductase
MRAVTFEEFGDAEVLHGADVPQPVPGPGQIRIRVGAAGVNPIDGQIRSGAAQAFMPTPLPAVLGFEVAGVGLRLGGQRPTRLPASRNQRTPVSNRR